MIDEEANVRFKDKYWWCPNCGKQHILLNTSSYHPRICHSCNFRVWIWGKYISESETGYRKLIISKIEKYEPVSK